MPTVRTEVDTCYIHNGLALVSRHYGELMCHSCYHLIQRMKRKYRDETGTEMSRDEFLTKAITRRHELRESGKWEKEKQDARHMPNIRIGITK